MSTTTGGLTEDTYRCTGCGEQVRNIDQPEHMDTRHSDTPVSTTTDTRTDTRSTFRGMYGDKACTFIIRDGEPYGTVLLDRDPGYGSMILSTVPRTAVTVSTVSLVKHSPHGDTTAWKNLIRDERARLERYHRWATRTIDYTHPQR